MRRIFALLLTLSLGLAGCAAAPSGEEGISIIATNFAGYDFARQVAGENAIVTMLLPPGADSHSFAPTPQDFIRVEDCDLFVYVGGESEWWVENILSAVDTQRVALLSMMELVDTYEEELVEGMQDEGDRDHGEEEPAYDEHVWTSPVNAGVIARAIGEALAARDPGNADTYRESADAYCGRLDTLHAELGAVARGGTRNVLLFGDRFPFRYFVEEYGLSYWAAFPGCSSDTESNPATIAFLIDKAREEEIPVVFYIEFSNGRTAKTICDESGAKALLFHSCHNVTADEFAAGVTYLDLMAGNVDALREALS